MCLSSFVYRSQKPDSLWKGIDSGAKKKGKKGKVFHIYLVKMELTHEAIIDCIKTGNHEKLLKLSKMPSEKSFRDLIKIRDIENRDALLLATRGDHQFADYNIVKILLDNGADVNVTDINGASPLLFLCEKYKKYSDLKLFKLLINHDANVNCQRNNGRTPLHECIMRGNDEEMRVLLTNGARLDLEDNYGWTPLAFCCVHSKHGKYI